MRPDRLPLTAAAAGVLFAAGCGRQPAAPAAGAAAPGGTTVSVVSLQRKAIRRVVEQPGAVQAYEETHLFAKVPGFVRTVAADIGQRVTGPKLGPAGEVAEPGQVLAELSVPELGEEANQKEALVRQAEAEAEQARKALAAADAGVGSAGAAVAEAKAGLTRADALLDRWRSEAARITGLVSGGVIDAQTRDETQNQFRAAQAGRAEAAAKVASADAGVRKARADRDKAAADVAAAGAKLDVAKADVRRLTALLGYTKITAPFDGVVTRRAVNTGDFLTGSAAKDGVFTVARVDPVRVVVGVPEADAGLVREGVEAKVAVQAVPGPDLAGKVARTSWSLEPGSRTLRAEVDLPNRDGRLRPGMYVYARIAADLPEAWAVPAAAVGKAGDDPVVYLVRDGKAVRTPAQVGRGDGQVTQVRRLKPPGAADWADVTGDERVATPAAALTDGQPVR